MQSTTPIRNELENRAIIDDGFTITIQPSGVTFDAKPHYACAHNILELTSGMRPGLNTFTLVVRNWMGLSMSYGSITGYDTSQQPYIIQVNSAALRTMAEQTETEQLPAFMTRNGSDLIVNGTVISEWSSDTTITPTPVITENG